MRKITMQSDTLTPEKAPDIALPAENPLLSNDSFTSATYNDIQDKIKQIQTLIALAGAAMNTIVEKLSDTEALYIAITERYTLFNTKVAKEKKALGGFQNIFNSIENISDAIKLILSQTNTTDFMAKGHLKIIESLSLKLNTALTSAYALQKKVTAIENNTEHTKANQKKLITKSNAANKNFIDDKAALTSLEASAKSDAIKINRNLAGTEKIKEDINYLLTNNNMIFTDIIKTDKAISDAAAQISKINTLSGAYRTAFSKLQTLQNKALEADNKYDIIITENMDGLALKAKFEQLISNLPDDNEVKKSIQKANSVIAEAKTLKTSTDTLLQSIRHLLKEIAINIKKNMDDLAQIAVQQEKNNELVTDIEVLAKQINEDKEKATKAKQAIDLIRQQALTITGDKQKNDKRIADINAIGQTALLRDTVDAIMAKVIKNAPKAKSAVSSLESGSHDLDSKSKQLFLGLDATKKTIEDGIKIISVQKSLIDDINSLIASLPSLTPLKNNVDRIKQLQTDIEAMLNILSSLNNYLMAELPVQIELLDSKADNTVTVGGHALTGDITISPDDFTIVENYIIGDIRFAKKGTLDKLKWIELTKKTIKKADYPIFFNELGISSDQYQLTPSFTVAANNHDIPYIKIA